MKPQNGERFIRLKTALAKELKALEKLKQEIASLQESDNPRIVGSILHDFYTGIEKMFRRIAEEFEGGLPKGDQWQRELLEDMSWSLEGIRPAVIDDELLEMLEEYLRFRHLFRNLYGFELNGVRMQTLLDNIENVFNRFQECIQRFNEFLNELA
jgi:hypothetical protein